jgi:hypothetical protein
MADSKSNAADAEGMGPDEVGLRSRDMVSPVWADFAWIGTGRSLCSCSKEHSFDCHSDLTHPIPYLKQGKDFVVHWNADRW